ncbi:MAG: ATP-binding protein [Anaerolineales bacterium]|nr:MAG: sensor histidine kinase [Chloroflexota bacterium]MBE7435176.1 ATP-binding protein [Anaerolineales bacterium]MCE7858462.1 sensor histidine kinase [Chloroflexi bacterium CFX2]MCK6582028.1 sensor histidine kinase [Anaerolineales bacterium]GJQ37032.1 MAG: histidine kinase [Anaerolineaceae bacterium]
MPDETVDYRSELDETQRALREVTLMMEQSQGELSKLAQRNTAITSHLQQIVKQGGAVEDIKMAYDSALDAQQRLLVMRGQLEKLQNDKSHLEKYKAVLEEIMNRNSGDVNSAGSSKEQMSGIEMIVNAQEAERQRLSRQMHDGPAQALSNFILQTEIAMRLLDVDSSQAKAELANLKTSAMSTFQKVRGYIFELRPMMLDDLGLVPTLRKYADAFKEQSGMDVSVTVSGNERRLEPYLEVMIFRAVQELLGNAARHSQATLVKVHLDLGNDYLRVTVDDNGRGFDPEVLKESGNLGLKLIRERSEMLGGKFEVDSSVGSGTKISFTVQARI